MHSVLGPWEEACAIYLSQSELEKRVGSPGEPLVIYDIGLGIAANSLAAIAELGRLRPKRDVEIYSFERYPEALTQALSSSDQFPFWRGYEEALRTLLQKGEWRRPGLVWKLVTGDFLSLDLKALPTADLIYFDFYAPAVCPELWTEGVFSKLFAKTRPEKSLLITYASSKAVRSAMLLAGYFVGDGATTKMKHETTVASRDFCALTKPLQREWIDRLEKSAKPFPLDWTNRQNEAFARIRVHPQFEV